jgi:hypothetical protein
MSQTELAVQCASILNHNGISRSIISRVESADRDAEGRLLAAIALATGTDYNWLNEPIHQIVAVEKEAQSLRDLSADKPLYLNSYPAPLPRDHPDNALVTAGWLQRDDMMHLPNPDYWTGLQAETLPIKVAV